VIQSIYNNTALSIWIALSWLNRWRYAFIGLLDRIVWRICYAIDMERERSAYHRGVTLHKWQGYVYTSEKNRHTYGGHLWGEK